VVYPPAGAPGAVPVVAAVSFEALMLLARRDNWFVRAVRAPGMALQAMTTREPDGRHGRSRHRSLSAACLSEEERKAVIPQTFRPMTGREALNWAARLLVNAGRDDCAGSARRHRQADIPRAAPAREGEHDHADDHDNEQEVRAAAGVPRGVFLGIFRGEHLAVLVAVHDLVLRAVVGEKPLDIRHERNG